VGSGVTGEAQQAGRIPAAQAHGRGDREYTTNFPVPRRDQSAVHADVNGKVRDLYRQANALKDSSAPTVRAVLVPGRACPSHGAR
jgi:hypothetical protein